MTLAGAFEVVAQNLKESGLTDSAFAKVADETSYIKAKLRVTPIQAFILATMLHHMDRTMQMMTFATFAQVSPVQILAMQKDLVTIVYQKDKATYDDFGKIGFRISRYTCTPQKK